MRTNATSLLWLWLVGCTATPLPMPPTADPGRMTLVESQPGEVMLVGAADAVVPGGTRIRVSDPPERAEVTTSGDGSFTVTLAGTRADRYFVESLEPDRDRFLVALTGTGGADAVTTTAPGPDMDGDDSPDAIDCAPADETLTGQRCAGADAGMADAGAPDAGMSDAGGCPAGQMMCGGACVDVLSDPMNCGACGTDCGPGGVCTRGACT